MEASVQINQADDFVIQTTVYNPLESQQASAAAAAAAPKTNEHNDLIEQYKRLQASVDIIESSFARKKAQLTHTVVKNERMSNMVNQMQAQLSISQDKLQQEIEKVRLSQPFMRVEIERLEDITKGLIVKYELDGLSNSQQGQANSGREFEDQINFYLQAAQKTIGVVGNYKKGKSYLMSQLSGQMLNQSQLERTQGLHFILGGNTNQNMYIDSAGHGEPLKCYEKLQELRELLKVEQINAGFKEDPQGRFPPRPNQSIHVDNTIACIKDELTRIESTKLQIYDSAVILEAFIQGFVLDQSDVLIVVVGQMTSEEERLISFVMRLHSRYQGQKRLIIVHNYSSMTEPWQVERQVQKDIVNSFTVDWQRSHTVKVGSSFTYRYQDPVYSPENPVIHFVFAHAQSAAGKIYNQRSMADIQGIIEALPIINNKQNAIERLCDFCSRTLGSYFDVRVKPEQSQALRLPPEREQSAANARLVNIANQVRESILSYFSPEQKQSKKEQYRALSVESRADVTTARTTLSDFSTFYEQHHKNKMGVVYTPLMSNANVNVLVKRPEFTIVDGPRPRPSLGQVLFDYIAFDDKEKKELTFFFEATGFQRGKIQVKSDRRNASIILQGEKKLPECFPIKISERDILTVQTAVTKQRRVHIEQGVVNQHVVLFEHEGYNFRKKKNIKKEVLYPNGMLVVQIDYKDEDSESDD